MKIPVNSIQYMIIYNYDSGDSFGTQPNLEGDLGIWTDLSIAKENIRRIREHYNFYEKIHSLDYGKSSEQIINENKNKPWFRKEFSDVSLNLIGNNGESYSIHAPWCGYFEKLNWIRIETLNDDMEFVPDRKY